MRVLTTIKNAGGCSGGVAIYSGAKALCVAGNVQRKKRKLWSNTKREMRKHLPKLDLNKVRFCIHSKLPANWYESPGKVAAMTFGYTIYFKGTDVQKTRDGLRLLLHELVHVDQVRKLGSETAFACEYGKGYLKAGSYSRNPMELAAEDLVNRVGDSLPLRQSNPAK
jgi:hypothetical protein